MNRMCGIFGYLGKKDSLKVCLCGLKLLEYRGYDSAGIAGISEEGLFFCKSSGKILELENKLTKKPVRLTPTIGHTRWATHGKPSEVNAHPHYDYRKSLALVHNGIIENYDSLRKILKKKGIPFHSDTDTEVIAQLISYHYKNNLLKAVQKSLRLLKGTFAIVLIHKDHPGQMIAASRESSLSIGYDKDQILLSSDPNAFSGHCLDILFLKNDEVALVRNGSIRVYDKHCRSIEKKVEKLDANYVSFSKKGFEHYMLKEIYEQPLTLQKAILGRFSEDFGTAEFEDFHIKAKELLFTKHILIVACGTSWHAGCIATSILEDKARIPTRAEVASELRYKNPVISNETLVIAISQSGETADTIAAIRKAKAKGAKILGICNVRNSSLVRESDCSIFLKAGPEISVCSTKAFTSQIGVLLLFTLLMARLRHMNKEEGQRFLRELKKIPQKIGFVLDHVDQIKKLAEKYAQYSDFFFLGRRYMYPTCLEAALKLKEISYLNANGYPAGELKHGPIALIHSRLPVIAFCSNHQTYDKMIGNLMEVKARGAPILAFAPKGADGLKTIANDIFFLPDTVDEMATFPSSVAGQLLAYYIAKKRGTEIDQPRNLAKSVTVE